MEIKKYSKDKEEIYSGVDITHTYKKLGMKPLAHSHHYEIFPYVYNSIVTMNDEIISKQSYHKNGSKHKVIYNGDTTIVILEDGSKGTAKRNPDDKYDKFLGYKIAKTRANIKQLQKELKELTK